MAKWPLKSICHSSFGADRSNRLNGWCLAVSAGSSLPLRRNTALTVEAAGTSATPRSRRRRASLRGPQGCTSRSSTICASIAAGVRRGLVCGRRERSAVEAALAVAPQILEASLPADAEPTAELRHADPSLLGQTHKFQTAVHDRS